MLVPAISTLPAVMSSKPPIMLNRVVFPEPEGPTIAVNSPSLIDKSTCLTASTLSVLFW